MFRSLTFVEINNIVSGHCFSTIFFFAPLCKVIAGDARCFRCTAASDYAELGS